MNRQFSSVVRATLVFSLLYCIMSVEALSQTYPVPEILYYKFNTGTTTTPNYASPGRGSNPASVLNMTMTTPGQFDSALVGNGGTGSTTCLNSGWNMDLATSSWTISMWINNFPGVTGTSYIFGNDITTSFRCFTNGAAGAGNITLRANNFANVNVTGVLPGPSVVHFVYDSATTTVSTYVNGVFQSSVTQAPLNLTAAVPFKVGSYGTTTSIPVGALVDEFRFYSRALGATEIAATWNRTLPYTVTGVDDLSTLVPAGFRLHQNYPNPFNPSTVIRYSIPTSSSVVVKVFDLLGREVSTLVKEVQVAGDHSVSFDGTDLPSGVYTYWLQTDGFSESKRMVLVK